MIQKNTYIGCLTVYQLIALLRLIISQDLTYILKRNAVCIIFNRELTEQELIFCTKLKEGFPLEFSII